MSAVNQVDAEMEIESNYEKLVLQQCTVGDIYFEKTLKPTNVSPPSGSQPLCCQMAMPAWFVRDHGDKIRKCVILQSGSTGKVWYVRLFVHNGSLPGRPDRVVFSSGWKSFACLNGLEQGDRLIFSLKAMSKFVVHILHKPESSPSISVTRRRCKDPTPLSRTKKLNNENYGQSINNPVSLNRRRKLLHESGKAQNAAENVKRRGLHYKLERTRRRKDGLLDFEKSWEEPTKDRNLTRFSAMERATQDTAAVSASLETSSSNTRSLIFELSLQSCSTSRPGEHSCSSHEKRLDFGSASPVKSIIWGSIDSPKFQYECKTDLTVRDRQNPSSCPSFSKQLVASNLYISSGWLEVPSSFLRKQGRDLRAKVYLQGILATSRVRAVCRDVYGTDRQRVYLTKGWSDFVRENLLQEGQKLTFFLTNNSFFVVRLLENARSQTYDTSRIPYMIN